MKRSDFFKTLCALPLISLFVKEKAKAETFKWPENKYCMRLNRNNVLVEGNYNPPRIMASAITSVLNIDREPRKWIVDKTDSIQVTLAPEWTGHVEIYKPDGSVHSKQSIDGQCYIFRCFIEPGTYRLNYSMHKTNGNGPFMGYTSFLTVTPPDFKWADPGVTDWGQGMMQKDHYGVTHIIPRVRGKL